MLSHLRAVPISARLDPVSNLIEHSKVHSASNKFEFASALENGRRNVEVDQRQFGFMILSTHQSCHEQTCISSTISFTSPSPVPLARPASEDLPVWRRNQRPPCRLPSR
jgi:hypothetical protein